MKSSKTLRHGGGMGHGVGEKVIYFKTETFLNTRH